ncbi:MAG TPA: hypothetical protein DCE44_24560, partial [Verrucomicrobiales bacterium]|nr:hypothetical protein [Verrucomicrobiales bacterium]
LVFALVAIVFLVALTNLYRQEPTQWITHALVVLGTVVAAYACYQAVTGSTWVLGVRQPPQYIRRASGTFINPNHLAGFLSLLLPLAVAQVFVGRTRPLAKILHGYAALVMMAGVAVSMSRGGWVAAGLGLVALFAWLGWRRRELRIPVVVALAVIVAGGYFFFRQSEKARARIENIATDGNQDSGMGRAVLWKPALAMWRDHHWWGVGPAQYDVRFPQYRTPRTQLTPGWVHNEYLNLLTDYGLVGTVLAGLTVAALVLGVVRSLKYVERGSGDLGSRSSNRTAFFLGASVGLGALGAHCLVDFDLHIPGIAVTATLVSALLAAHIRFATERFWFTLKAPGRGLLTIAAAGAWFWMLPVALAFGREAAALNRIAQARAVTPQLINDLEVAARQMPDNSRTAYELGENLRRLSFQGEAAWQDYAVRAVEWLQRAAQLNRYDARTQLALGQTYRWLNDPAKADAAFARAFQLGPNDVVVANTLAWYALQQGHPEDARKLAEDSLSWQGWSNELAQEIREQALQQLKAASAQP